MKLDKLTSYSIITSLFFIAVYTELNNIGFIALLLLLVFNIISTRSFPLKSVTTNGFIFIGLFLLQSISLLYSHNLDIGLKLLEKQVWLLIIPLLLIFTKYDEKQFKLYQKFLFFGGCFSIALAFIHGIIVFDYPWLEGKTWDGIFHEVLIRFTYHNLATYIGNHALYYSCYLAFSTIVGLNIFFNHHKPTHKKYYLIGIVIHILVIFLLKSSTVTMSFIICFLMMLFSHIDLTKSKNKLSLSILSSIVCTILIHILVLKSRYYHHHNFDSLVFLTFYLPAIIIGLLIPIISIFILQQKKIIIASIVLIGLFLTVFIGVNYFQKHPEKLDYKNNYTNINARYGKWLSAIHIIKEKPLLGSGIGDRQEDLMTEYKVIDFPIAITAKYNEHNQYFRYWLDSGLLSLLLFLFLLIYNLKKGINNQDYTLISLCILLSLFSITESCLVRQKGIIFFVFILSLYDIRNNVQTVQEP